jgi:cell division septum initiation protein DivIVA
LFGKFFDTAEVDKFADLVVAEVKRALPAGYDHNIKNVSDRTNTLDQRIDRQVQTFTQFTKLNIYKKARLAARVREALTTQGYPVKFFEPFTLDLLNRVQKASKRPESPAP